MHRISLLAAAVAFASAILLSIRRQYRAAAAAWDNNQMVFAVAVIGLGLLPVALVLFALLQLR
jgi:hypothetical protein